MIVERLVDVCWREEFTKNQTTSKTKQKQQHINLSRL